MLLIHSLTLQVRHGDFYYYVLMHLNNFSNAVNVFKTTRTTLGMTSTG